MKQVRKIVMFHLGKVIIVFFILKKELLGTLYIKRIKEIEAIQKLQFIEYCILSIVDEFCRFLSERSKKFL